MLKRCPAGTNLRLRRAVLLLDEKTDRYVTFVLIQVLWILQCSSFVYQTKGQTEELLIKHLETDVYKCTLV